MRNAVFDLIEKSTPTYPAYGKRIILDNGWYQAIKHPNAELICDSISRISETGIETDNGVHRDYDIIVFATGFKVGKLAARLNITGPSGQRLQDDWADDDPKAYLGIMAPGYPNLFMMQGPNTGLAHGGSAIFQSECQANYITQCLLAVYDEDLKQISIKQEPHDSYVADVDAEHERLVWTHPGMSTYYRNQAGRVVSVMPWRLVDYWHMTRRPNRADFDVCE